MNRYLINFDNYVRPEDARDIWNLYEEELNRVGVVPPALDIVGRCCDAETLDIRLFLLLNTQSVDEDVFKANAEERRIGLEEFS
jgi:hypothetical protein